MPKQILHIKLKRDDQGTSLFMQSELDWAFILAEGSDATIGGVACRPIKPVAGFPVDGITFTAKSTPTLFDGEAVNIAYLGAKNLRQGALFTIPENMPVSAERLKKFVDGVRLIANRLYRGYMKPVDLQVTITTSESEVA